MWKRLVAILCLSTLVLGLAALPAQALEARVMSFRLRCDGTPKNVVFNATGMGVSLNRFIMGAGVALTQPRGGIRFLRLQAAPGDATKTLLVMGLNEMSKDLVFTTFMVAPTNAFGNIPFEIVGACNGGGLLQGIVTIYFFS